VKVKRLLVSVHDVTPAHSDRLEKIVSLVEQIVGPGKAALLVVPDFHGKANLDSDRHFKVLLRRWADAGNEIFLHGYYHLEGTGPDKATRSWKAKCLTAGEGEFLGLGYDEAASRLRDGQKLVEEATGRPVAGFVAPAWLYGPDAKRAIRDQGFRLAEDHFKVWNPATAEVLTRGPVITYASRTPMRLLSSLLWSYIAGVLLKPAPVVRIGVHPHDWDAPELVDEIQRTLTHFVKSHVPSRYSDLQK
jgi:uncharacterized protein